MSILLNKTYLSKNFGPLVYIRVIFYLMHFLSSVLLWVQPMQIVLDITKYDDIDLKVSMSLFSLASDVKPQSHIHDFGPGRATVHPELASR